MKVSMQSDPLGNLREPKAGWLLVLAVFCYIDLLFLPYFQLVILPISLPMVFLGLLTSKAILLPKHFQTFFLIIALFMILSFVNGLFLPQSAPYIGENFKRLFQFLTSFSYFIFFYHISLFYKIEKYLFVISVIFLAYFICWIIYFIYEPSLANMLLSSIYGRIVISENTALIHLRFSYFFSDPNTAAYFLLIAILPWLVFVRSMKIKISLIGLCLILIFFIQSRGALIALVLSVGYWLFLSQTKTPVVRKKGLKNILNVIVISTIFSAFLAFITVRFFADLQVFDMSIERIFQTEAYQEGGSRPAIWLKYVSSLIPLPIGRGYMFDINVDSFFPHSDALRLVYSYGFIVAILYIGWMIRSGLKFPLLFIPAFMAFSINTLIDEQKLFALFLATLGVFIGFQKRNKYVWL